MTVTIVCEVLAQRQVALAREPVDRYPSCPPLGLHDPQLDPGKIQKALSMRRFLAHTLPLARVLQLATLIGVGCTFSTAFAQPANSPLEDARYSAPQLQPLQQQAPLQRIQPQVTQAQTVGAPLAQVASLPQQPGPTAQQRRGPTAPQRGRIGPPFQVTPVEQQFVDQILQMWENESSKITTFNSRFELWEYDLVFGPGAQIPGIKSTGQLTYSKPDKGSFKIDEIRRYQPQDAAVPQESDWVLQDKEVGAHWVCDGKAVYEYKHNKKQLVVQPLPPEMQGKEIVNGPLPFLFGAKAAELKRRYWIRSKQGNPEQIWLEAYPRDQRDAANYHHVEIILDRKAMQPQAIKVHSPNNQSHSVYMFDKPTINGKLNALFGGLFNAPRTPFGWKRVVQNLPAASPAGPQAAIPQSTTQR